MLKKEHEIIGLDQTIPKWFETKFLNILKDLSEDAYTLISSKSNGIWLF